MTTNFKINGINYGANLTTLPADITLNTFIREHAQLTATKFMCLEGGCGACVCVIKGKHPATGKMRTWAANSCLTLLNTCADWEITTAEGIGNKNIGYHPIQRRLAKMNGTQCGFCSPGFVMNMYGLLESKGNRVTMKEVENSFGGNICRCTGYRPILDAMKSFASDSTIKVPQDCQDIEDLCTNSWDMLDDMTGRLCLDSCHKPLPKKLSYMDGTQWHWPKNLNELFQALNNVGNDEYMLVAGNTAHGVYRRSETLKHFIDIHAVGELKQHKLTTNTLTLGGALSLTEAMEIFLKAVSRPGFEYCQQLWQHFDLIANVPVRNMGTLAGNINIKKMHPEFPSDVFIVCEALDVQVIVNESVSVQKTMSLMEYLQDDTPKTVLTAFQFKAYPKTNYIFSSYKIMPRAQNAHAYVNAAFLLDMNLLSGMVNKARICFGGINPQFVHAQSVETLLIGQYLFDSVTVSKIFNELSAILVPNAVLPEASPEYRISLGCSLFYKFLLSIAPPELVKPEYRNGGKLLKRPLSSGLQTFGSNTQTYPVTQPVQKIEGLIQCTGEATYMNDTLTSSNSVYCAFVTATRVGATIEQIDASEALQQPGVLAFYAAIDIPGSNTFVDPSFVFNIEDEEIFCADRVKFYDQPLGVIAAITSDIANHAAKKVRVIYSNYAQVVLPTLEDVLSVNRIVKSNTKGLELSEPAEITGNGILLIGPQYHYTMEPQTTVVVPFEQGIQVWSATQWLDQTQYVIAKMLKVRINDVQLKVRRLGGGFGSKITRGNQIACAASLVAYKLNRPARFVQTIESMMNSIGKRWACRSDYVFHIKTNGRIVGLLNCFYEDAGCGLNENPIDVLTMLSVRNCYDLTDSNSTIEGHAVLTDAPSATWCRAPGSIEGVAMMENIIEHIAFEANIDPVDARLVNIKSDHKMAELLPRFVQSTEYHARRLEIDDFNLRNRWRKRGLGLALMEFPINYFGQFPATVTIYHGDGTCVISHGGVEIGQGMNTKIAQVAAFVLGIPLEMIKIEASDTINGANAVVTGNSMSSESLCFAVRKACETLNERLAPIRTELPANTPWEQIVQVAWGRNVNLIASDYFKQGDLQNYKVFGLGLTEIEVDILTGSNQIRRVDICEDAGESLSPYIDIGQIEGAFVMGLGYWLTEQLVYDRRTGQLLTNRTWNYKPPGAKDIPIDFRIEVLQNSPNPAGFMRSKTTGEPPACLAVSAMFALRYAIMSARQDAGLKREWLRLGAPTTPEHIVMSSGTNVAALSLQ